MTKSLPDHAEHRGPPCYWGYDTGKRTCEVMCFCGKHCHDQESYENHMRDKHPRYVRQLKQCGCWQQYQLDGWTSIKRRKIAK